VSARLPAAVGFVERQTLLLVVALRHDAGKRIEFQSALFDGEIDRRSQPSDLLLNRRALDVPALEILNDLAAIVARRIPERCRSALKLSSRAIGRNPSSLVKTWSDGT
jgi:hypothetical protein